MSVSDKAAGLNLVAAGIPLPPLIVMTDEIRLADPVPAMERLPRGSAVIFRHYGATDRETLARRVVGEARRLDLRVLIAGDAQLAARTGACGLHMPEAMAARGPGVRQAWRRRSWLVTASAHSPAALFRAARAGADAALLAPVFATASHPDVPPLGPVRFALWCRRSPLPVYALGGVTADTWPRLQASGAVGFAGIGGFLD